MPRGGGPEGCVGWVGDNDPKMVDEAPAPFHVYHGAARRLVVAIGGKPCVGEFLFLERRWQVPPLKPAEARRVWLCQFLRHRDAQLIHLFLGGHVFDQFQGAKFVSRPPISQFPSHQGPMTTTMAATNTVRKSSSRQLLK